MGENSAISWTTHTFNPWWGCVKVSPACTNCYAATFDKRVGGDHWGPKADRRFFGDKHWNEPRKWNAKAAAAGIRERVFCASMADVFEDRRDLDAWRDKLWDLIVETPHLDWLLLTKRPENLRTIYPWSSLAVQPRNVWLGTTVENQEYARERIPHLLAVPAVVHFLSCEPLLGPIHLGAWIERLSWVIAGCESGHHARATETDWLRVLRDQCAANRVPFLLKQAVGTDVGRCGDADNPNGDSPCGQQIRVFVNGPGDASWSCGCTTEAPEFGTHVEVGAGERSKRKAGGVIELPYLDGIQHAEFPEVRS